MLTKLLLLFLAGGCGTLARYGLSAAVRSTLGEGFPFATTVVNAVGCLAFGLVVGAAKAGGPLKEYWPIAVIGFLGAFTTFATFAGEAEELLQKARYYAFAAYLLVQNGVGILFVTLGLRLMR